MPPIKNKSIISRKFTSKCRATKIELRDRAAGQTVFRFVHNPHVFVSLPYSMDESLLAEMIYPDSNKSEWLSVVSVIMGRITANKRTEFEELEPLYLEWMICITSSVSDPLKFNEKLTKRVITDMEDTISDNPNSSVHIYLSNNSRYNIDNVLMAANKYEEYTAESSVDDRFCIRMTPPDFNGNIIQLTYFV